MLEEGKVFLGEFVLYSYDWNILSGISDSWYENFVFVYDFLRLNNGLFV